MITGYLTAGPGGRLTDNSELIIDGHTYPVPTRTEVAGIFAPHRVMAALRDAGYRPATDYHRDLGEYDGNGYTIQVVPL